MFLQDVTKFNVLFSSKQGVVFPGDSSIYNIMYICVYMYVHLVYRWFRGQPKCITLGNPVCLPQGRVFHWSGVPQVN